MKRNYDLLRDILIKIEEQESRYTSTKLEDTDEYSKEEIFHHYVLLKQAGFIDGKLYQDIPFIANLTWEGHNFLEDAKNQTVWEKTKTYVKEKGGSASFQVFAEVLKKIAFKQFEI